jgi:hypothetical protein
LRFGILCDGTYLQNWQRECVEQLMAVPGVVPEALLVAPGAVSTPRLFRRLDKVRSGSPHGRAELPDVLVKLPVIEIEATDITRGDSGRTVESAAVVRALRLDFILSFSASPRARVLCDAAEYGVWDFQFGDWEHFRGSAPGFWEVYYNAALSGCVLARLTPDADVIVPLRRGYLNTLPFTYPRNRDQLLRRFTHWPAQVCREILQGDRSCLNQEPVRSHATVRAVPTDGQVLWFAIRMLVSVATRGVHSLLQSDHWNIGIVDQPIAEFLDAGIARRPVRWLPPRRSGEFVADPFGLMRNGQLSIFCEFLDYRDGVGRIAAIQPFESASLVPVEIGPQPPVHLSYPLVFEHDGRMLCIPETQAAREVAVYGLEEFPHRWRKLATLIENRAIVDATLFRHADYWWLAGAADGDLATVGSDLHLWFAPGPLGPWTAHPSNPVKTDVRSARPAGTPFVVDGVLYRPSQDSSTTYGARIVLNRVESLTPTSFREQPVAFVEPDAAGPYPDGLHTICAVGDITVIDGKRLAFSPPEFRRMLLRMLKRRLRRVAQLLPAARRGSNSRRHKSA